MNVASKSRALGESSYRKPQTAEADVPFVVASRPLLSFGYGTPTLAFASVPVIGGISPVIAKIMTTSRHGKRVTVTWLSARSPLMGPRVMLVAEMRFTVLLLLRMVRRCLWVVLAFIGRQKCSMTMLIVRLMRVVTMLASLIDS